MDNYEQAQFLVAVPEKKHKTKQNIKGMMNEGCLTSDYTPMAYNPNNTGTI